MVSQYNGQPIEDANVAGYTPLISPYSLKSQLHLTDKAIETVRSGRRGIRSILEGDDRIALFIGPCSIHDIGAAKEYAHRLSDLKKRVEDRFAVVMRTYFEKPRTIDGWKGLINDPYLDGSGNINDGLYRARQLLRDIAELGLPSGTEWLDPFTPQFYGDLVSWGTIGARTVESQPHRQMASGLSMPIGFKNNTSGNIEVAVNAVFSARRSHQFWGLTSHGVPAIVTTRGNRYAHITLRGGNGGTNYDQDSVRIAQEMLRKAGLEERLAIDCSHGNSGKDYRKQPEVFEDVIRQRFDGNEEIVGIMLESNIHEGSQKVTKDPRTLLYGVSITDACIAWDTTQKLVLDSYRMLAKKS